MNKRALAPLVATLLLVAFALVLGTITMNWGKVYVEDRGQVVNEEPETAYIIAVSRIDTPLKQLQIDYILGKMSEEEYLQKQNELING